MPPVAGLGSGPRLFKHQYLTYTTMVLAKSYHHERATLLSAQVTESLRTIGMPFRSILHIRSLRSVNPRQFPESIQRQPLFREGSIQATSVCDATRGMRRFGLSIARYNLKLHRRGYSRGDWARPPLQEEGTESLPRVSGLFLSQQCQNGG